MSVIGKRYAEGLADIAYEQKHLRDYLRELKQIQQVFESSTDLGVFLANPEYSSGNKHGVLDGLFADETSPEVLSLLHVLLDAGRIGYLNDVVREYRHLANRMERVFHVEIFTPYELSEDECNRIAEQARIRLKASEMRTEVIIDPTMRGGVVIRAGDFKYDFSLDGAIENLRAHLKQ